MQPTLLPPFSKMMTQVAPRPLLTSAGPRGASRSASPRAAWLWGAATPSTWTAGAKSTTAVGKEPLTTSEASAAMSGTGLAGTGDPECC